MLVLAIFHFLFVLYNGIQILIEYCKTKTYKLAELIDLFCDICRSILLLLVGLPPVVLLALLLRLLRAGPVRLAGLLGLLGLALLAGAGAHRRPGRGLGGCAAACESQYYTYRQNP